MDTQDVLQGVMKVPAAASALNAMIADAFVISITCTTVQDRAIIDPDTIQL